MNKLKITDKKFRVWFHKALERYGCEVIRGLPSAQFDRAWEIADEIESRIEEAIQRAKGGK